MRRYLLAALVLGLVIETVALFGALSSFALFSRGPITFITNEQISVRPAGSPKTELRQALALNERVRSRIKLVGRDEAAHVRVARAAARRYVKLARADGLAVRYVSLFLSPPFDMVDRHAIAEVWAEGKWIVMDPTFGTYYELRGKPASAAELRENLLAPIEKQATVEVKWAGRSFKPSPNDYHVDVLSLYNNVVYGAPRFSRGTAGWSLTRLPIARYFSRELYTLGRPRISPFELNNYAHLLVNLIMPLSLIILASGLALSRKSLIRQKGGHETASG